MGYTSCQTPSQDCQQGTTSVCLPKYHTNRQSYQNYDTEPFPRPILTNQLYLNFQANKQQLIFCSSQRVLARPHRNKISILSSRFQALPRSRSLANCPSSSTLPLPHIQPSYCQLPPGSKELREGSLRGGEGAQPGRPSAGSQGTRRRRRRLRNPERIRLPWLLWGLTPAAAADWPPSPPTCPGRHVGRKRRVTQRPNGCRGGSGGGGGDGGAACPELPRRREAGGGGRRGRRGPIRSGTVARRGLVATCVRLQGGVGRGGRPAAPGRHLRAAPLRGVGPLVPLLPRGVKDSQLRCLHFSDFLKVPLVEVQSLPFQGSRKHPHRPFSAIECSYLPRSTLNKFPY
uniref:Uncharacterized protein n=1 Tax=Mustela putorius furo TaxID=9669 RepID=M3XUB2_MUSPF